MYSKIKQNHLAFVIFLKFQQKKNNNKILNLIFKQHFNCCEISSLKKKKKQLQNIAETR